MKMTKMKYLINYTYKGKFKNDEIDFNGFAFEMFSVRYSRRRRADYIDEYVSYRQPAHDLKKATKQIRIPSTSLSFI